MSNDEALNTITGPGKRDTTKGIGSRYDLEAAFGKAVFVASVGPTNQYNTIVVAVFRTAADRDRARAHYENAHGRPLPGLPEQYSINDLKGPAVKKDELETGKYCLALPRHITIEDPYHVNQTSQATSAEVQYLLFRKNNRHSRGVGHYFECHSIPDFNRELENLNEVLVKDGKEGSLTKPSEWNSYR